MKWIIDIDVDTLHNCRIAFSDGKQSFEQLLIAQGQSLNSYECERKLIDEGLRADIEKHSKRKEITKEKDNSFEKVITSEAFDEIIDEV